jgi:hypothetical protein
MQGVVFGEPVLIDPQESRPALPFVFRKEKE